MVAPRAAEPPQPSERDRFAQRALTAFSTARTCASSPPEQIRFGGAPGHEIVAESQDDQHRRRIRDWCSGCASAAAWCRCSASRARINGPRCCRACARCATDFGASNSLPVPPKHKNPGRSRGSALGCDATFTVRSLLLLLLRQLQLHLRVADRRRRDFLGAHVLEHHQIVRRVFLGQAGAGPRGGRAQPRRSSQRQRPACRRSERARASERGHGSGCAMRHQFGCGWPMRTRADMDAVADVAPPMPMWTRRRRCACRHGRRRRRG